MSLVLPFLVCAFVVHLQLSLGLLSPTHFKDDALEPPLKGIFTDLGEVVWPELPTNVSSVRSPFLQGLALLHTFLFDFAAEAFRKAQHSDPDLGIAYWGEAMTRCVSVFWGVEDLPRGRSILQRAFARPHLRATPREWRLLNAARAFYGEGAREERLAAYLRAMKQASLEYPSDVELKLFWLVGYMAQIFPYTRGYDQRFAASPEDFATAQHIATEMVELYPRHPGALHYNIHFYDMPKTKNIPSIAVRVFGHNVASSVPHARHMPSHIYLRRGEWKRCAAENVRAMMQMDKIVEYFDLSANAQDSHNVEFLQYARLMAGQFAEARNLTAYIRRLADMKTEAALNANNEFRWRTMQARLLLQEGLLLDLWPQQVSELPPRPNCSTCWVDAGDAQFLFTVESYSAATFGNGMHAVATGNFSHGKLSLRVLENLVMFLHTIPMKPWFGPHPIVRIMALQLHGFIAFERKKRMAETWQEPLVKALDEETKTDPPGYDAPFPLVPTGELLGTLLLKSFLGSPPNFSVQLDQQAITIALRAIELFRNVANNSPNRPGCVLGAARANRILNRSIEASRAYEMLLNSFDEADSNLWILQEARDYIAQIRDLEVPDKYDAQLQGSWGLIGSKAGGPISVVVAFSFLILVSCLFWCKKTTVRCCLSDPILSASDHC